MLSISPKLSFASGKLPLLCFLVIKQIEDDGYQNIFSSVTNFKI